MKIIYLEWSSAVLLIVSIYMYGADPNHIAPYAGFLGCAGFAFIGLIKRLYGVMTLNIVCALINIYNWTLVG